MGYKMDDVIGRMFKYRVTYYGRRNLKLSADDVVAKSFAEALGQIPVPTRAVRVWIALVPTR